MPSRALLLRVLDPPQALEEQGGDIDAPERDAFAPKDQPTGETTETAESDTSFEFGHNRQAADNPAESDDTGDESQDDDPAGDGGSPASCDTGAGI